jgi:hypothetical protein
MDPLWEPKLFSRAYSKSAIISSESSIPAEKLTSSSVMPVFFLTPRGSQVSHKYWVLIRISVASRRILANKAGNCLSILPTLNVDGSKALGTSTTLYSYQRRYQLPAI